jgi:hypothetical protein
MKMGFLYVLLCGCVGCAVVERAPLDPLDSPIFVRGGIYRAVDEAWTKKELKAEPCEQCKLLFYVEAPEEPCAAREPKRGCEQCVAMSRHYVRRGLNICQDFSSVCKSNVQEAFCFLLSDQLDNSAEHAFQIEYINNLDEPDVRTSNHVFQTFILCLQSSNNQNSFSFKSLFLAPSNEGGIYFTTLADKTVWKGAPYHFSFKDYLALNSIVHSRERLSVPSFAWPPREEEDMGELEKTLRAAPSSIDRFVTIIGKENPLPEEHYLFSLDSLDAHFLYIRSRKLLFIFVPTLGWGNKYDVRLLDSQAEINGEPLVQEAIKRLEEIIEGRLISGQGLFNGF